jgi:hypothetical protein
MNVFKKINVFDKMQLLRTNHTKIIHKILLIIFLINTKQILKEQIWKIVRENIKDKWKWKYIFESKSLNIFSLKNKFFIRNMQPQHQMIIFQNDEIYKTMIKTISNFFLIAISFRWMNINACQLEVNVKMLLKKILFKWKSLN